MDMDKKGMLEYVAKAVRRVYMEGFTAGGGGNMDIRIQGQVYISSSGGYLEDLTAEDMIMLEADDFMPFTGGPDYGDRQPFKEAGIHLAHYRSRPGILCLFYLHSSYSITVACRRQEDRSPAMGTPAYTPRYAMHVRRIPVVPYYRPGDKELAEAVSKVTRRWDSLPLVNRGIVAAGKSPEAMLAIAEEIRESVHFTTPLGDQGIPPDGEQTEALSQTGERVRGIRTYY